NFASQTSQQQSFQSVDQCKGSPSGVNNIGAHNMGVANQLDYFSFDLPQDFEHNFFTRFNGIENIETKEEDVKKDESGHNKERYTFEADDDDGEFDDLD
nr:transcription factor VOZ1-like isoform X1 [Tanacetum cinerariifolium]